MAVAAIQMSFGWNRSTGIPQGVQDHGVAACSLSIHVRNPDPRRGAEGLQLPLVSLAMPSREEAGLQFPENDCVHIDLVRALQGGHACVAM
jgi:hypothetical protein